MTADLAVRRLEEMAEAADHAHAAVLSGDKEAIRRYLTLMRSLRPFVEACLGASLEMVDLLRMKLAGERVKAGETALDEWQKRPSPTDAELVGTAEGIADVVDRMIPIVWDGTRDVVVLLGAGAADVAAELWRRGQRRIAVWSEVKPANLLEEVCWVRNAVELRNAVMGFPGLMASFGVVRNLSHPMLEERFAEALATLEHALESARSRRNTLDLFGAIWVGQGIENMPRIAECPPTTSLKKAFRGKPMVVVAPGPSLAKNVHLLRSVKGKAVIVTFTHALHALQAAGVTPDIVLALDPEDLRYHFDGIPLETLTLVLAGTVHPDVYRLPVKRIFTFAGNSVMDDWMFMCLGETPTLMSGGCVAHTALALGFLFRADPIIYIGQDLAFTDDRYYVETSIDAGTTLQVADDGLSFVTRGYSDGFRNMASVAGKETTRAENLVEVPGYHGGMVRTSAIFRQYIRWFEHAVGLSLGRLEVINATEGGAHIENMRQMPFAEAISGITEPLDVDEILARAFKTVALEGKEGAMRSRRDEIVVAAPLALVAVAECIALCEACKEEPWRVDDLMRAEKELEAALRPLLFSSIMHQADVRQAERKALAARDLAESLEAARLLYRTIHATVSRVQALAA